MRNCCEFLNLFGRLICAKCRYLFRVFPFRVQDALIEQNRRLPKGRTEKKYSELLQNKYSHIVGTPKWAKLNRENDEDSDDSDNEILKVSFEMECFKIVVYNKDY